MVGQKQDKRNRNTVCCFCGGEIELGLEVQLVVYPNEENESQILYTHKSCIDAVLHSSIPRHPDLLPD